MKRRVSILCHTLAGNALGRAWVFHELLRDDFEPELVVSARQSDEVWQPLRAVCSSPRRWFVRTLPGFHWSAPRIAREFVTGDLIIAIKPRLHSFGLALAAQRVQNRPILLDVDDWELGFFSPWVDAALAPFTWVSAASNLHTRWYFRRTARADAITVTSTELERRFGGINIPHARPDPRHSGELSAHPLVMFVGTPRPHKGLADLLRAFQSVNVPGAELCVIGAERDRTLARLASVDRRIRLEPTVPMDALPERLGRAWVVVIPQRDEAPSQAQLPAKLIDAMALGKAIVSTSVGDIPRWLADDCGVVVPPGDVAALARTIEALLKDPARRSRLGENARARFLALASESAVKPHLCSLVESLLARAPIANARASARRTQAAD